ncbi:DUF2484 family protein [Paracoccus gahaiensis]|uniref:DUF2484 family protein n=1 Tax=Paracoccus gahaiensis TaxID=1706839 RepID=UPI001FE55014|nr:DUF2484 family protein [Paracoccus gahaiensis]
MTRPPDLTFLATQPRYAGLALALVVLWLVLACLVAQLPARWQLRATRALILAGVPALGWLTLLWGPGIGVAGLGMGLLILLGRPTARRRRRAPPVGPGQGAGTPPFAGGPEGHS